MSNETAQQDGNRQDVCRRMTETLGYVLARTCHAHRQRVNTRLAEIGLHVGQEMFLLFLWQNDGMNQSELAEAAGVQPATVTRMLSRMESAGLVERRKDPEDSRVMHVFVSDAGWAMQAPVLAAWEAEEVALTRGFTTEERLLLRRLLWQLNANAVD